MKRDSIAFSHKYSKLDKDKFHTVRWLDFDVEIGKEYFINLIAQNPFHTRYGKGKMRVMKLEVSKLKDLHEGFCMDDADCSKEDFSKLMQGWYGKKEDWKGEDSEIMIIYLERVK